MLRTFFGQVAKAALTTGRASSFAPLGRDRPANPNVALPSWQVAPVRWAQKKAGGSTRNKKSPPGKNYGIKMYGGHLAFPGQIIVRQRGTKFFPGYNVGMGKDFTIFATGVGFVKYRKERFWRLKTATWRKYIDVLPINGDWSQNYKQTEQALVAERSRIKSILLTGRQMRHPPPI